MIKQFLLSVHKDGGASLNILTGMLNPNIGYFTSYKEHEKITIFKPLNLYKDVQSFYEEKKDILLQDGMWLGAWVDGGRLYMDVSKHFNSEKTALRFAKKNKQISYYDCIHKTIKFL